MAPSLSVDAAESQKVRVRVNGNGNGSGNEEEQKVGDLRLFREMEDLMDSLSVPQHIRSTIHLLPTPKKMQMLQQKEAKESEDRERRSRRKKSKKQVRR